MPKIKKIKANPKVSKPKSKKPKQYKLLDDDYYSSIFVETIYSEIYDDDCDHQYCNCMKLSNIRIVKVNYHSLCWRIAGKSEIKSIKDYCLNRIVNLIEKESFDAFAVNGYYGQEIEVKWDSKDLKDLNRSIKFLNENDEDACVEHVLEKEYGFVLDDLKNKHWEMKSVPINQITTSSQLKKVNNNLINSYISNKNFTCLCIKDGATFRLMDGYHRYAAALKDDNKKITAIYCHAV